MSVRHSDAADEDLLSATDDLKKEYIKHMIELAKEDMKMVMIYVAAFLDDRCNRHNQDPNHDLGGTEFLRKTGDDCRDRRSDVSGASCISTTFGSCILRRCS